jgi:hypothetical protein
MSNRKFWIYLVQLRIADAMKPRNTCAGTDDTRESSSSSNPQTNVLGCRCGAPNFAKPFLHRYKITLHRWKNDCAWFAHSALSGKPQVEVQKGKEVDVQSKIVHHSSSGSDDDEDQPKVIPSTTERYVKQSTRSVSIAWFPSNFADTTGSFSNMKPEMFD